MSLILELLAPLDQELNNEASKDGISPSDHAAILLCIAAAFHDLGEADTPFQHIVKEFSKSHSVDPSHLASLVNTLVEYCQMPTGDGKTEAALEWLKTQSQDDNYVAPFVLSNWRLEIMHSPWNIVSQQIETNPHSTVWPEGFFESTFGSFEDAPLERLSQDDYEQRDEIE
jgi:hypothetical protein